MKKDRLKPHVYKVKGKTNYGLYDIFQGQFYKLSPSLGIEKTREFLKNAGLIFETEGEVPFKTEVDIVNFESRVSLRVLQKKLEGRKEDTCWQRHAIGNETTEMKNATLASLYENLQFIPVREIRIEAGNAAHDAIAAVISRYNCQAFALRLGDGREDEVAEFQGICKERGVEFSLLNEKKEDMTELVMDYTRFFYSRQFNPCLGHQVAVDTGGEIKPCLWSDDILGNIADANLKNMIIGGVFDTYWEMKKDKIEDCKECERRYACRDCRVSAIGKKGTLDKKPSFCEYHS
ncbi:MAG: SPASM domain-containing protein [bacterium]|nr:SPASM domain-containing protein [bacterium]